MESCFRHGGGSANELRYPLGIRPGSTTTRKLYFAEASWGIDSFDLAVAMAHHLTTSQVMDLQILENATDGWVFPDNPTELRLLLISTLTLI